MGTIALIGLGSNLGARKAILDAAVDALSATQGIQVRGISSYHETAPVGGPAGQGPFLNAAVALDAAISANALHDRMVEIENQAGRVRVVRWGERTLDLDLLIFGNEIHNTASLTVPHPRMFFRRFVLAPVVEVAPTVIDPLSNRSMQAILAAMDQRPSYVAIHRADMHEASGFVEDLALALHAELITAGTIRIGRFGKLATRTGEMSEIAESFAEETSRAVRSASGGWVVSDLWLDGFSHWAISRLELGHRGFEEFRSRFFEARRLAPTPMMVVIPHRQGPQRPSWADHASRLDPQFASPSILHLESEHKEVALAEILAACASSRPDGRID